MDKNLGQIFTPKWIVKLILDNSNYFSHSIIDKAVLEPSFGDGAFLVEIVDRFINECENKKINKFNVVKLLDNLIHGIEIDKNFYQKTITRLNDLLISRNYPICKWKNLINDNALIFEFNKKFDFIFGNPPYIRVHNLSLEFRNLIKKKYLLSSSGTIDSYIVFIELGFLYLKEKGILGYITPNTFFKNSSALKLRTFLLENKYIKLLINFGHLQVFKNINTYNAVSIFQKNENDYFWYKKYIGNNEYENIKIPFNFVNKNSWNFFESNDMLKINNILKNPNKLTNISNIQYGLATLRDKIYISSNFKILKNGNYLFNNYEIENEILLDIIKGADVIYKKINKKIIFPYFYNKNNNKVEIIPENELKEKYPLCYSYFLFHKEELQKRNIDKNSLWYAYGRSQGLQNILKEKIVLNTMINGNINLMKVQKDILVYSGIFVTTNNKENMNNMYTILSTEKFYKYVIMTGKDLQNNYKTLTTKQIKEFSY